LITTGHQLIIDLRLEHKVWLSMLVGGPIHWCRSHYVLLSV